MTGLVSQVSRAGDEAPTPEGRRNAAIGAVVVLALVVLAVVTDNVVYVLGFAAFFLALLVSVVLHEAGHFLTARRYGMKATQFFVGFGPTLFSRQRGETEYGVKAVPAGGFVKIVGMTPLEEVDEQDADRAFYRAPTRHKVVVLSAGSIVHFLIAGVVLLGGVALVGVPEEQSPAIAQVSACIAPDRVGVTEIDPDTDPCTLPGAVPAPAAEVDLRAGDVVVAVDGREVDSSVDLTSALRAAGERSVDLTVERDGATREVTLVPAVVERFAVGADGAPDPQRLEPVGTIGIRLEDRTEIAPVPVSEAPGAAKDLAVANLEGIYDTFTERLGTITQIYSDDRDPAGFVGIIGVSRISGETIETDQFTDREKAFTFVSLVVGLNIFVGIFNLLPLLPLDGGHIAVAVFEGVRDKLRRLRGYRGPRQVVDYQRLLPVTYAVAGFFALFTIALIGADLLNPIRITS